MGDMAITIADDTGSVQEIPEQPLATQPTQLPVVSVDLQALMTQAIDKGVSVETMERLLAMWEKLRAQAAKKAYFDALRKFQSICPIIDKDAPVYDKHGNLRYKYAKLEKIVKIVQPLLTQCGFSHTMQPIQKDNRFTAIIVSTHTDGHSESTSFEVPINDESYMTAPQKVGEARTYAERGAFNAAYGIHTADGDIDANNIDANSKPRAAKQQEPAPKKENGKSVDVGTIPPENAEQYKKIMTMVREKFMGCEIFSTAEQKEKIVKAANAAVMRIEDITAQCEAIEKVAAQRRNKIQEAKGKE